MDDFVRSDLVVAVLRRRQSVRFQRVDVFSPKTMMLEMLLLLMLMLVRPSLLRSRLRSGLRSGRRSGRRRHVIFFSNSLLARHKK